MFKKIISMMSIALFSAVAVSAAPITDFTKDKIAIDINYLPKVNSDDVDAKTKDVDFGLTAALNDKWGIQYRRNGYKADTLYGSGIVGDYTYDGKIDADITTDQINILYSESENRVFFAGYTRTTGNISASGTIGGQRLSARVKDRENGYQVGMVEIVPIGQTGLKSYGSVGLGNKLCYGELGLSQPLSDNLELDLFYRYTKYNLSGDIDPKAHGAGIGLTCKF